MTPAEQARQQRMCGRKRRYWTARDAGVAADELYQRTGDWLGVYRCPWCRSGAEWGWHVGGRDH
jgi:hypothetical protein